MLSRMKLASRIVALVVVAVFVTAGGMFFATSVELSHQLETREYETGRDHIRTLGVVFEDHFSEPASMFAMVSSNGPSAPR